MTGLTAGDHYLMVKPLFPYVRAESRHFSRVWWPGHDAARAGVRRERVLARVAAERVHGAARAPDPSNQAILDHPDRAGHDLSSLRIAVTGAADIPVELVPPGRRRTGRLRRIHHRVRAYGGRTASATSPADDPETVATPSADPRPGFEVRIVDADGQVATPGASGEILLRSAVSCRYYSMTRPRRPRHVDDDG